MALRASDETGRVGWYPTQWGCADRRLILPPQDSRVRAAPWARSQSVSRYPAMRVRIEIRIHFDAFPAKKRAAKNSGTLWDSPSRTPVDVLPIERNPVFLVDGSTPTPSEPVDKRDTSPRRLHKLRSKYPKGDVHSGGGAATVGAEAVRRGRPTRPAKASLFFLGSPARND